MAKRTNIAGVEGLHRALRALPREASVGLRDESGDIARDVADMARSRGMGVSRTYARFVAPTIRASRDRVPVIRIGSKRTIPGRGTRPDSSRQVAGELLWGAEFGGRGRPTTLQFLPHLGTTGYALWPTIRAELPDIMDRWADALYEAAVDAAAKG